MAFENVNYGMIPQSKMQQQSMLMQSIGQVIGNYQKQQQLDMQRRQLDMKANARKPMDFEQVAMEAVYKKQLGMPVTPQEEAAIGVMAQTKSDQSYLDPNTGQMITRPNPFRALVGGAAQAPTRAGNTGMGQGTNQAISSAYDAIAPKLKDNMVDMNQADIERVIGGGDMGAPQLPVQGNPLERKDIRKANIDLQKDIASKKAVSKMERESKFQEMKRPTFEPIEGFEPSQDDMKTMTKITVSKNVLDKLVDQYKDKINERGVQYSGTAGAKELDALKTQIMMQTKNLEELGALAEADMRVMNDMIGTPVVDAYDAVNPVGAYSMATGGKNIALNTLSSFQSYLDNVVESQAESRGFKLKGSLAKNSGSTQEKSSGAISYEEYFK